jgi:hypothetical protein
MLEGSGRTTQQLASQLSVGDLVFIRVPTPLFMQVAEATGSWTNHVGVVINEFGSIAESRVPISGRTTLRRFVRRSSGGRVAVARLRRRLAADEKREVAAAAERRSGILYDTGFDLHSRRQFCSRFAREVVRDATGIQIGTVQRFTELLEAEPEAPLWFWQLWYFGQIPWERETVTPASLLRCPVLEIVFDGAVEVEPRWIGER